VAQQTNSGKRYLRPDSGKCIHYYFYFIDEELGLCYLRVPTWAPYRLQFYFNGHNWLAAQLEKRGIGFTQLDNVFLTIELRVANINQAYAVACANYFANAHRELTLYGVTGTKGKTTTCHLIEAALRHAGFRTGLISTLVRRSPECEWVSSMTTPEPAELHRLLFAMRSHGATPIVIEASSIGPGRGARARAPVRCSCLHESRTRTL
jgi:hypothetical protein